MQLPEWLQDRGSRRIVPIGSRGAAYGAVRNIDAPTDGQFVIGGHRQHVSMRDPTFH